MFKKILLVLLTTVLLSPSSPAFSTTHGKTLNSLNSNDIMFAQMMIPHHRQAIEMASFALKNSSNQEVKALAKSISAEQGREIVQMKYWLSATKSSTSMGHGMGHAMDTNGMLTDSQMRNLGKLKITKFDKAFLEAMINHHVGALEMVKLLKGTKNSEARKLATDIARVQKAEVAAMKKLLAKVA
jgi:uncharacterized protein (DUF305 family)